jgi:carbamoylphosphate synthase large subunit
VLTWIFGVPIVVKPRNEEGGTGVVVVTGAEQLSRLKDYPFMELSHQQYVDGEDVGGNDLCGRW